MIEGRMPTVPEYYREHINSSVDLTVNPKQCCPFHQEDTPSFSYNIPTGRWSCFGRCHAHGGVIEMHMRQYHFNSKEEAEKDLKIRYKVPNDNTVRGLTSKVKSAYVPEEKIEDESTYVLACSLAVTPERWLELDYVMSKYPYNRLDVQGLINKWQNRKSVLDEVD